MSSSCWPKGTDFPNPKDVVTLLCPITRKSEESCHKDPGIFKKFNYFTTTETKGKKKEKKSRGTIF